MSIFHFFLINVGALFTAIGGVFLKRLSVHSSALAGMEFFSLFLTKDLWLGGICYVLPIGLWAYILRSVELTKLQPMLSIVYVYTVGLAFLMLDERPSSLRLIGIAVVVIGVIIVGKS